MFRKIDIYGKVHRAVGDAYWVYKCSTFQSRTCKEARSRFAQEDNRPLEDVKASFAQH